MRLQNLYPNWLRELFRERSNRKRENHLRGERNSLQEERGGLYDSLSVLEEEEISLLRKGKFADTDVVKRRIVTKIKTVRDDIKRVNAKIRMKGQMIEVVNVHLHNLDVTRQRDRLHGLPTGDELAEGQAEAEALLEELEADTENLEVVGDKSSTDMTHDELAIFPINAGPIGVVNIRTSIMSTLSISVCINAMGENK